MTKKKPKSESSAFFIHGTRGDSRARQAKGQYRGDQFVAGRCAGCNLPRGSLGSYPFCDYCQARFRDAVRNSFQTTEAVKRSEEVKRHANTG